MRDEQACRKRDREQDARCGGALDEGLADGVEADEFAAIARFDAENFDAA